MIQINVLGFHDNRVEFLKKSLLFLTEIKEENRKKIKLVLYTTTKYQYDFWEIFKEEHKDIIINVIHTGGDYMTKIRLSIDTDCEYSCSMDDDIMLNNYVWDYLIENVNLLDNEENIALSPVLSNGIPTVDYFLEDFCTDEEREEVQNIFKNTAVRNYWGVNYSSLNNFYGKYWNYDEFYDDVSKLDHFYKGIHPVRISIDAHRKIAEIISNNYERMLEKKDYYIQPSKFPYLCNSFYLIKTDIWKKIINDPSLFRDGFDEVPLNLYKEKNDLNFLFVRNGLCLHMAYNTIGREQVNIQNYFYENFLNKI